MVEVIVAAAVFTLVALSVYQGFVSVTALIAASRDKIAATDLMNSEFELIRNMPFASVGLLGGIPSGVLKATSTVVKDGRNFNIARTIRNIDDPFDGTIGGSPNDLSPADYKMVQIEITCPNCKNPLNFSAVSNVAPRNLETASENGALFVRVFDANGQPVPQASVRVENQGLGININDTTNNGGLLAIVDAPPAQNSYRISVAKDGFTSERTYASTVENPNPVKPDATVLLQQLTQISFIIDKVSTINVFSKDPQCAPVPNVPFTIFGEKLIGTEPDVLKWSGDYSTDGSGVKTLPNIEWDSFNLQVGEGLDILDINPPSPFEVLPGSTLDLSIVLAAGMPTNLLVSVVDSAGLPLDANLTISSGEDFSAAKIAGSECLPSGQVVFSALPPGDYSLLAEKSGYRSQTLGINLNGEDWRSLEIVMLPE